MGKKEYYTFADLIIKLRDYYQEVQRILKEMEKCILIQTPHKVKYAISFSMTDSKFSEYEKDYRSAKLILAVSREDLSVKEKLKASLLYLLAGPNNPISHLIANAKFYWVLDGGEPIFNFDDKFYYEQAFRPDVTLTDQSYIAFCNLCDSLRRSRLYSLSSICGDLNWFQNFVINGEGLTLNTRNKEDKWLSINYVAATDKIKVSGDASYDSISLESLLMTRIPKSKLNLDYSILLDSIPATVSEAFFDDDFDQRIGDLEIILPDIGKAKKIGERKPTTCK